jgi:g-D-glutamyl-meso-diaminopimelate peptidase
LAVLVVYLYLDVWFYVQAQPPMIQSLGDPPAKGAPEQTKIPLYPNLRFKSIVRTKGIYDYETMISHLQQLADHYEQLTIDIVGESIEKRAIYLVKLGHGSKKILLDGAHHGNEWISSFLLMTMVEHYAYHYHTGQPFYEYDIRALLSDYTLCFVPMVNPDGVEIVASNGRSSRDYDKLVALNGGKRSFAGWKANARGVDLNRQYPTNWPLARDYGPATPAMANYAGSQPLTEPEVIAIDRLHQQEQFAAYLTYHSVGNMIFYYYYQTGDWLERDRALAYAVGRLTGYEVRHSSGGIGGMARDHVVTAYQIPTLIMELGINKQRPLPEFAGMWERNRKVPCLVITWLDQGKP